MVCDKEFVRRTRVTIGFYVKRISEGMGRAGQGEGYSAGAMPMTDFDSL
jgi:hypothetical protein